MALLSSDSMPCCGHSDFLKRQMLQYHIICFNASHLALRWSSNAVTELQGSHDLSPSHIELLTGPPMYYILPSLWTFSMLFLLSESLDSSVSNPPLFQCTGLKAFLWTSIPWVQGIRWLWTSATQAFIDISLSLFCGWDCRTFSFSFCVGLSLCLVAPGTCPHTSLLTS